MKKKISLFICMLAAMLCFTACGSNAGEEAYDTEMMEQVAEFLIDYCVSADDVAFEQWYDTSEFSIDLQLTEAGLPFEADSFLSVLKSWQAGVAECGAYIEHGDFSYEKVNGSIEASADAKFEDRDATISFAFDENYHLESMTISAKMSLSEILKKAGMNTLLGMGTVFSVLIIIAFIIWLFKFIPAIQAAFTKKPEAPKAAENEKKAEANAAPAATASVAASSVTDDSELIAVIAAAIAAAEGTTADGFVVRSIRRRPSNKWNSK